MSNWHCEHSEAVKGDDDAVLLVVGAWVDDRACVEVEIEEGDLSVSAYLTAEQARAMADALHRAADRLPS